MLDGIEFTLHLWFESQIPAARCGADILLVELEETFGKATWICPDSFVVEVVFESKSFKCIVSFSLDLLISFVYGLLLWKLEWFVRVILAKSL